jgi:glycerophosphoryl diester phosphodiesterase
MHNTNRVLNDVQEFERAYQMGVDGIMTDKPILLRAFLKEKATQKNQKKSN